MSSLDELHTIRLRLTRPHPGDFDDLCRMRRDPEVMATLGGVRSASETELYLGKMMAHWDEHGFGWWIAHDSTTGAFVGRGGLRHVPVEDKTEIEVGYGLMKEFWDRGLASELAAESVRIGFDVLGFSEIVSFTLPTNLGSRRVMEKVGFRYERDFIHADLAHVLYRLKSVHWRAP